MTSDYKIPELLQEMMVWEQTIKHEVPYLETPTGYFLQFDPHDHGGYLSSPADAIVFANTGMGGIHFSFLTDFGHASDLSLAPIICVDPMAFGHYARIVASNIREFFALGFSGHEDLLLNEFESKQQYLDYVKEQEENTSESEYFDRKRWDREKKQVQDWAVQHFNFKLVPDGYSYIQEAQQLRRSEVIVDTLDGLGVALGKGAWSDFKGVVPHLHPWHGKEIPYDQEEQLKFFISSADQIGLFSLIRDSQAQGFDDPDVYRAMEARLISFGLGMEAKKLMYYR
ncbi:hypothetical protein HUB98_24590 [Paenibacillus barcinonensis]|uniref:Uncharacterized protein n=1 Tax=Paenibacillus barcinonensis TaxID=198119 RepID=A0A2V4VSY6_PAEBA|nr:hypothetical protein [Paenibacillus barcinonensis]PYE47832.1 hypothetical protein DFQ00_111131 [Paenibacillus barcinonensis]QKS59070.1 hypothetical protein HUB98_24590 [Paenibacillus barcinonensis]